MNPVATIDSFRAKHPSFGGNLIVVGAMVGHGKSTLINSMIMCYLHNEVDVLCFSENQAARDRLRNDYLDLIENNTNCGRLYMCNIRLSKPVEYFVEQFGIFLNERNHTTGNFVIIFDGPMFEHEQYSFDFINLNTNTRRVIFEKINNKTKPDINYILTPESSRYVRKTMEHESLINLSKRYNANIIITEQIHRNFSTINRFQDTFYMLKSSQVFIIEKLSNHTHRVDLIKNRFGPEKSMMCEVNPINMTLEICNTEKNIEYLTSF